jgi:ABC-type uncharacterized transport system fused permease/ATPase subunit
LRFCHGRVRQYCESIAFYGGEAQERVACNDHLDAVFDSSTPLLWNTFQLFCTSQIGRAVAPAVAALAAYLLLQRNPSQEINVVTLTANVSGAITTLMQLVQLSARVAPLVGHTHRLGQLLNQLEQACAARDQFASTLPSKRVIACDPAPSPQLISLEHVTLSVPNSDRVLVRDLSLHLNPGTSVVITGPSGCGKSSLLRVIGGLWDWDDGIITRPQTIGRGGIFFVPQRPYITSGSLRVQVLYPHQVSQQLMNDDELERVVTTVGLGYLLQRWGLDQQADWADMLSGGEQQRLGFARLLYHRPAFAVMDEATSALDEELQARCLQACQQAGIAMINVAHRPTVLPYHEWLLVFKGPGNFQFERNPSFCGSGIH